MSETITCRKCGEDRVWDKSRKLWRACRNGCSQYTAVIPDGTELTHTLGSTAKGMPIRGDAIVRKPTCHD